MLATTRVPAWYCRRTYRQRQRRQWKSDPRSYSPACWTAQHIPKAARQPAGSCRRYPGKTAASCYSSSHSISTNLSLVNFQACFPYIYLTFCCNRLCTSCAWAAHTVERLERVFNVSNQSTSPMTIETIAQMKTRYPWSLSHMREVGIKSAGMVVRNVMNMMMALTMAAATFICQLQSTNVGIEGLTNRSGDIVLARGSQQLFPVLAHDSCGLSLSWGRRWVVPLRGGRACQRPKRPRGLCSPWLMSSLELLTGGISFAGGLRIVSSKYLFFVLTTGV